VSALVDAHIQAQARIRAQAAAAMTSAWRSLPSYNESDVPAFLARAVPITTAAQRASVSITSAFVARRIGAAPRAVPPSHVMAAVRNGTPPSEVYRRPFVDVWSGLKAGTQYAEAVATGLDRATSSVQMDVQLAMRQTLTDVAAQHTSIVGYQRVPDAGACNFCRLIAGQRYHSDQLMPVHNRCGCGVDVITAENRGDFTGKAANDQAIPATVGPDGTVAAVEQHGELGPLVVDGRDSFTHLP
jgi:hypothetical protein